MQAVQRHTLLTKYQNYVTKYKQNNYLSVNSTQLKSINPCNINLCAQLEEFKSSNCTTNNLSKLNVLNVNFGEKDLANLKSAQSQ